MQYLVFILLLIAAPAFAGINIGWYGTPSTSSYILGVELSADLASGYGSDASTRGTIYTTDTVGGTLTQLCVRISAYDSASPNVKLGIYAVSGGVPVNSLLAQVEITTTGTGNVCGNVVAGPTLLPNNQYWIGVVSSASTTAYSYEADSAFNSANKVTTYADEFTDPAGTYAAEAGRHWSVWGVYVH